MQTRSWEKDGQKQYRTEVVADRVQFGPKGSGAPAAGGSAKDAGSNDKSASVLPDYPEEEINPRTSLLIV